jgi:hypothetical protein
VSLVLPERIELSTSPLPRECSTTELRQRSEVGGAGIGAGLALKLTLAWKRGGSCHRAGAKRKRGDLNPGLAGERLRCAGLRDLTLSMTKDSGPKGGKADKQAARGVRLSAALRENLKRRKEQARARVGDKVRGEELEEEPSPQETGHDAASDSPQAKPKT